MPQQPQQHSPLPPPPPPPPPSSSSSIRPNSTEGITKRPKRRLQVGEDHHGVGTHNSTTIATGAKITTSGWEITSELTTTGASRYEKYADPEYYYSLYPSQQQQQQHQLNHRTTSRAYRYNSRRPWHHPQDSGQFTDDYEEDLSGVSLFEMPRLNDFHVRYRKALHVPDNHYREYLQRMDEQTSKSVSSTGGASYTMSSTKGTWVNSTCCAQSCAVFSAIAVLFLFMIGIILDTQPLYIKGCLPYQVITANERGKTTIRYTVPPLPTDSRQPQPPIKPDGPTWRHSSSPSMCSIRDGSDRSYIDGSSNIPISLIPLPGLLPISRLVAAVAISALATTIIFPIRLVDAHGDNAQISERKMGYSLAFCIVLLLPWLLLLLVVE